MKLELVENVLQRHFAGYANDTIAAVVNDDEALALLKRALHACSYAKKFRFNKNDDSYKLAADIEKYIRKLEG